MPVSPPGLRTAAGRLFKKHLADEIEKDSRIKEAERIGPRRRGAGVYDQRVKQLSGPIPGWLSVPRPQPLSRRGRRHGILPLLETDRRFRNDSTRLLGGKAMPASETTNPDAKV